jgi:hypothetical protein
MRTKYTAQALAIVMIVLVVAVIIGMAMFSRTLKDTQQITQQKSSAEALEFADSVLDIVKGTSATKIKTVCNDTTYGQGLTSTNGCVADGNTNVSKFLNDLGVTSSSLNILNKCSSQNSSVQVTAQLAKSTDDYEISRDNVRSFVLGSQTPTPAACTLNLTLEPRGGRVVGAMISKIYARNYVSGFPQEYKSYSTTDSTQYCVYQNGSSCADNPNMTDQWVPLQSNTSLTISLGAVSGYPLNQIRVRAIGGALGLKYSFSTSGCVQDTEMVKIVVAANCTGTYRAKVIQIPQQDWASPIFDYALFNGTGVLAPE